VRARREEAQAEVRGKILAIRAEGRAAKRKAKLDVRKMHQDLVDEVAKLRKKLLELTVKYEPSKKSEIQREPMSRDGFFRAFIKREVASEAQRTAPFYIVSGHFNDPKSVWVSDRLYSSVRFPLLPMLGYFAAKWSGREDLVRMCSRDHKGRGSSMSALYSLFFNLFGFQQAVPDIRALTIMMLTFYPGVGWDSLLLLVYAREESLGLPESRLGEREELRLRSRSPAVADSSRSRESSSRASYSIPEPQGLGSIGGVSYSAGAPKSVSPTIRTLKVGKGVSEKSEENIAGLAGAVRMESTTDVRKAGATVPLISWARPSQAVISKPVAMPSPSSEALERGGPKKAVADLVSTKSDLLETAKTSLPVGSESINLEPVPSLRVEPLQRGITSPESIPIPAGRAVFFDGRINGILAIRRATVLEKMHADAVSAKRGLKIDWSKVP
jgi:hypothetical protein